jgi:hypothetical protein
MANIDTFKCDWCGKLYKYRAYRDKHLPGCKANPAKNKKQKTESTPNVNVLSPISQPPSLEKIDDRDKSEIAPSLVKIINSMQNSIIELSNKQSQIIETMESMNNSIKRIRNGNSNNLLDIRKMTNIQKEDKETVNGIDESLKDLTDKFEKFKDVAITSTSGYCQVCWDNPANYAFTPCGHKAVCGTCAAQIMGAHQKCVLCRERVYDMIQIWDGGQKA